MDTGEPGAGHRIALRVKIVRHTNRFGAYVKVKID
jgi:hypothetical protein